MAAALDGIHVLDLTHDWAGPHAARMLADYGADVIKVEYPGRLDGMRGGVLKEERYNRHPRFWQLHRNKRSLTLDLTRQAHRERALRLLRWADVVIDGARPGVLDRLGLSWEVMREQRADIILVRMSAYGSTGPDAPRPGYGGSMEAASGLQSFTAYGPGEPPRRIREVDAINGLAGACAILTAIVARQATGKGACLDMSQNEAVLSSMAGERLLAVAAGADGPPVHGNRHPRFAPHGCYPCRGDDRWVTVSIESDAEWQSLCAALARPDLAADPRLSDVEGRRRAHDSLDDAISAWTRQRNHREAMEALQAAGVRAGAVFDAADVAADPHLAARGWILDAQDGSGRYPGVPFRLSRDPVTIRRRGPDLGEHNIEISSGIVGISPADVEPLEPSELGTAYEPE